MSGDSGANFLLLGCHKQALVRTPPPHSAATNDFGRGALQYQMDTGVRLTLLKAGAFGENTVSKSEGSLGEKSNFGSKLGSIGWEWECYFWSFSERFKNRNLQNKIVENGKNYQFVDEIETKSNFLWLPNAKNRGVFGWERFKSPISPK